MILMPLTLEGIVFIKPLRFFRDYLPFTCKEEEKDIVFLLSPVLLPYASLEEMLYKKLYKCFLASTLLVTFYCSVTRQNFVPFSLFSW